MAASLLAAVGAAGCSLAKDEDTGSSPDEIIGGGDPAAVLKSTLILEGGCTAAKVGPKQLLVSARCVSGNAAFAVGKTIVFTSAASGTNTILGADDADDAGARPKEAGAAKDASSAANDAGAKDSSASTDASDGDTDAGTGLARDLTIAEVKIHPSYVAKCKPAAEGQPEVCGFNTVAAGDSPDLAIILLEKDLETVPSIPVDLDPVGLGDPLLVMTSGCTTLDGKAPGAPKTAKTIAVPAKSVNHDGSAYKESAQKVPQLAASYVVTAGAGWRTTEPRLCKSDLSSPIFRGGAAAVAGVTSNYTTYVDGKLPVTTHHTRVDAMSRFKIGAWLTDLGALTIHSCSETAGGCVKRSYDGGTPEGPSTDGPGTTVPGDGGPGDATAPIGDAGTKTPKNDSGSAELPEEPEGPRQEQLPPEPSEDPYPEANEDYSDAAAPKKKKKAEEGGCSAAPGNPAPTGELFLGFGLVLGAAIVRRRRARA